MIIVIIIIVILRFWSLLKARANQSAVCLHFHLRQRYKVIQLCLGMRCGSPVKSLS